MESGAVANGDGAAQASVPQAPQEATATISTTTTSTTSSATSSTASGTKQSKRVLTVGDGNFSYSLAYAKRFLNNGAEAAVADEAPVTLTATSYDSYEELVDKYPESARICAQTRECGAAQVLHRVDATNLKVSLENALKEADSGEELEVSKPFDVIIFNHPHCGEENVRRHQSLLSHFYASALEILSDSNEDSEIHLTLAKGQPERWEAIKRARLAGLVLKQQIDDVDSHELYGLEYERKRHQNGKSFHRVLLHGEKLQQQSTLFIFARPGQGKEGKGSATQPQSSTKAASTDDSPAAATAVPSRKRKAQDAALQQPLEFACTDCAKSFKTAQGLKTHVHMVHELGHGSAATAGAAPAQLLPCGFCERTFKNEDAQRQHRLAKHGEDQFIQPDWYQKQQELKEQSLESVSGAAETSTAARTESVEQQQQLACGICRFVFPSQTVFDEHWQNLKPKEVVLRNCSHCGRAFDEERALRQHQNFCKAQQQQQPEDK